MIKNNVENKAIHFNTSTLSSLYFQMDVDSSPRPFGRQFSTHPSTHPFFVPAILCGVTVGWNLSQCLFGHQSITKRQTHSQPHSHLQVICGGDLIQPSPNAHFPPLVSLVWAGLNTAITSVKMMNMLKISMWLYTLNMSAILLFSHQHIFSTSCEATCGFPNA